LIEDTRDGFSRKQEFLLDLAPQLSPKPVSDSLIPGGPQSLPQRIGIKCHGIH
jgi:hypothetical protein